jgi:hypothetical protein
MAPQKKELPIAKIWVNNLEILSFWQTSFSFTPKGPKEK